MCFPAKNYSFLQGIISFLFIGLYWCNKLECFNLQDYNISVNPTVENAVGVAAFRFGHSQIRSNLIKLFKAAMNVPNKLECLSQSGLSSPVKCLWACPGTYGAPERCFTWVNSGLIRKHQTRLERPAWDIRSSLL